MNESQRPVLGILSMGWGASSDLLPLKVESVNPCTEAMIRRRRADSVCGAAGRRRGSKKKIFEKVEKFSKSQNARRVRTIFFLCIERDTAPLRWQKMSKFFHRLLRFDSPALCLTKDW